MYADYIYHRWCVRYKQSKVYAYKNSKDNVLITTNLLEAAKSIKLKDLYLQVVPTLTDQKEIYMANTKLSAENIIKDYNKLFKIKYTILRYATVYGTNNRGADVISLFTKNKKKSKYFCSQ